MIEAMRILQNWLKENNIDYKDVDVVFRTKNPQTSIALARALKKLKEEMSGIETYEYIQDFYIYGIRGRIE